jgi:type VI protein secretion system component VasF
MRRFPAQQAKESSRDKGGSEKQRHRYLDHLPTWAAATGFPAVMVNARGFFPTAPLPEWFS